MSDSEIFLLVILIAIFVIPIIYKIITYFCEYREEIRFVKMEMRRSGSKSEYNYWKNELSAVRYSIIPGLNTEKVKKIKRFLSRGKHERKKDNIVMMLAPMFISIAICSICLAGSTYAWFTANVTSSTNKIQSANYYVDTTLNGESFGKECVLEVGTYDVSLRAQGSAKKGFCVIYLGDKELHTEQILPGEQLAFQLTVNKKTNIKIVPQWGISAKGIPDIINEGHECV